MNVRLSKPQAKIHAHLERNMTLVLPWGRGVGKSWFVRLLCYLLVVEWDRKLRPGATMPGVRIVLLMPTLTQAKKVHKALFIAELATQWAFLGGELNRTDWRIEFPGGSWIQWVSAENALAGKGLRCDVILADECDGIDIETYESTAIPWLSEPHSLGIKIFAGTPERGRNGLLWKVYKRCLDGAENHFGLHATYKDVPEFVDNDARERDRHEMDPATFKREWLCDFDSAEGLVFPMFDPKVHVREWDPRIPFTSILVGVDHGWQDPGVFLVIGVVGSGKDAIAYVLEEIYETQRTQDWWIDQAKMLLTKYARIAPHAKMTWYCDPSRPDTIEQLRRSGCKIGEVDNSIEDGLACVASMMSMRELGKDIFAPRMYVSPSCKNYIRELGLYRYKKAANSNASSDVLAPGNDHAADCARYALHGHFRKPDRRKHDLSAA